MYNSICQWNVSRALVDLFNILLKNYREENIKHVYCRYI